MGVISIPEISVIVPVFRVEQYLDRCVESILTQTFRDFEIILVDDGSPDKCPEMCDSWTKKDSRIRVVHQKNGGLSAARNAGLQVYRGSYVAFVDSDDWIEPQMLEYLHSLLKQHPEAQIAQCDYEICRERQLIRQSEENIRILSRTDMLDYFFRIHGEASNDAVWNKLYDRRILEGFSFVITLNEDVEASLELFLRADKLVMSNQKLYHYYVNQQGITKSKFSEKDLNYLAVWDRVVEKTKTRCPNYIFYAQMGRKRANFTMLVKM